MFSSMFQAGDRVRARRALKPFRDGNPTIRPRTLGTVHAIYHNKVYVEFDSFACPVYVAPTDIDLLSVDAQIKLTWSDCGGRVEDRVDAP